MSKDTQTPETDQKRRATKQVSFQCPVELYDEFVKLEIQSGHRKDGEFLKELVNAKAAEAGSPLKLEVNR